MVITLGTTTICGVVIHISDIAYVIGMVYHTVCISNSYGYM